MKFFYNVLRLPFVSLILLLPFWSLSDGGIRWHTPFLGSNLVSFRALFWALSLYILFAADIPHLYAKYSAYGDLYADYVQAYVHGTPSQFLDISSSIESLAADLDSWMSSDCLSLNPSKTQMIWLPVGTFSTTTLARLCLACCTVSSIYLFNFCSWPRCDSGQHFLSLLTHINL